MGHTSAYEGYGFRLKLYFDLFINERNGFRIMLHFDNG